jgi:3-hydroxyisobutyrate dehydrogenase
MKRDDDSVKTEGSKVQRIGFAGLGIMGGGMARNFLAKGYPLTVWNRTRQVADLVASEGANVAGTPRELAATADVVVTSLATPAALESVAYGDNGLLAGARAGTCWIDTSTVGSVVSLKLAAAAGERGVDYLESPVTGSKDAARAGTLLAMIGGSRQVYERLAPILAVFAQRTVYVGPHGSASVLKLIGNTFNSFMLEGLAEGALLGAAAGIPLEKILEMVQASGFASPYWALKGGAMAKRDFETKFSLDLLHKDQALMLDEAASRHVPLPGLVAIHEVTSLGRSLGFGSEDVAAQLKALERVSRPDFTQTPSSHVLPTLGEGA